VKILFIAHTSFNQIGGHERYSHQFANALATSLGGSNVLFWPVEQSIPLRKIDDQVYTFVSPLLYRNLWFRRVFHRYLLFRGIDRIIVDTAHLAHYAQKVANFLGVPYDVMTVGIEVWGSLPRWIMEPLMCADSVFTLGCFTRDQLVAKGVPLKCIRVLPCHVDVESFFFDRNDTYRIIREHKLEGKKVILTICRLAGQDGYKGYDRVIQSLSQVLKEVPNAVYMIVGEGSDKPRIQRLVRKLELTDHVIFAGRVPDDAALRAYYSACDLFVMPSQTVISKEICKGEGFGIVYIEANACGKPVIAGNAGGEPGAVIDSVSGLLVDPMNVKEITGAIMRLLKDEKFSHQLGQQGLRRVREELSLPSLQKRSDAYLEYIKAQKSERVGMNWLDTIRKLL
jgi:phosphatidyl-myo-inositol dimannoside synthase